MQQPKGGDEVALHREDGRTWCISGYLPYPEVCRPLFFAQKLDAATESEVGQFYPIYSANQARALFGAGSIATLMAIQWECTCPEQPLYIAPLDDPVGGTRAVHTITITGPATDNGILSLSILDEVFAVGVIASMTADQIATNLAMRLQRWRDLPFDVTLAANVVTLTARNAGMEMNWFIPQWNPNFGDAFPPGVSVEIATPTAGSGLIDIDPALPVMACRFDCVGLGVEDEIAANTLIQIIRQNWRCGVQGDFLGGHLFHSRTGTSGTIFAYGMNRNNPEECIIPIPLRDGVLYKYPGFLLVAAMTARVCCGACTDPSRPVQYDNGVLGCLFDTGMCTTVWSQEEKRMFWDAGIVLYDIANARGVRQTALWIEEPLTSWKWDPQTGAPDGAWQRVETRYTVTKFVRDLGNWYRRHYASVSLVNDAVRIPPGKRAVSPRILKASILAWFKGTQLGWTADIGPVPIENMINVERTNIPGFCDPNRVNVMIDLDTVNQLARIATTIDVSPEFACLPPVLLPGQVPGQ